MTIGETLKMKEEGSRLALSKSKSVLLEKKKRYSIE